MKRTGEIVFCAAFVAALLLYGLTAPSGLPWNASTHLSLAYLGKIVRLPVMPYPVWGFYVRVFDGAVGLSVFLTAFAAGLIASFVCRRFGWRLAASAAMAWTLLPCVWNRAITGQRSICVVSMIVFALWALSFVRLNVLHLLRPFWRALGIRLLKFHPGKEMELKRWKSNRLAARSAIGASVLLVLASLTFHDYRLGEAAGVFARGVVEAADGRMIVLNGVCNDQIVVEAEKNGGHGRRATVSFRRDDAYRANLADWVRTAFPSETNLWIAAEVGPQAFLDLATREHPDRFYLMNGLSTTVDAWEKRWEAFKPYLKSDDPFVRVGRRLFGHEGNAVANAMLEGETSWGEEENWESAVYRQAWGLYRRVYEEVDPGNFSALVNMSEMIRRGYAVSGDERKMVQERLDAFFKDPLNRKFAREIARIAGPVRGDPELMERLLAAAKKRLAEKIAAGEKVKISPEMLSLVEWNNEMCSRMKKGELVMAGRIARAILSNPKWKGFIPANAVMGSVASGNGDYVAGERFFRVAVNATNEVPTAVLNDYADTLLHLGKLAEAETVARRAIRQSDDRFWQARLTLAEVLETALGKAGAAASRAEVQTLVRSVLRHAPLPVCDQVRKDYRGYVR